MSEFSGDRLLERQAPCAGRAAAVQWPTDTGWQGGDLVDEQAHQVAFDRLIDAAREQAQDAGAWVSDLPQPPAGESALPWAAAGRDDASSPAAAQGEVDEAHAGDQLGAYRLVRPVARGGMGSVWLAERVDGALHRQVALKLPHLAWGAGLAERMLRERDIASRLEHPHIARLYDAGVDHRGRPFLAFEFIDGVAIDLWCRSRQLNVRGRLKLFLQVAQAVAYAHARLVVHRDLKPSNVLVSPDGQVHLLDFGIAKLLHEGQPEDAGATQRLGAVLTPHYASPEQLRGEPVTVASDVYSLGVMLFELLTGERPHAPRRAGMAALEEAVLQAEPAPASRRVADRALARALRGDLDAILAKALRRQPEQRYATVDALADDVQHHLAGEPVRARPATAAYRLARFVARHRAGSAAVAVVVAAVAVGTVVVIVQAGRAGAEARQALLVKQFVIDAFRASAQVDQADEQGRMSSLERMLERNSQLIARANEPRLQAELYGIVAGILLDAKSFGLAAQNARKQIAALERADAVPAEFTAPRLLLSQALLSDGFAPLAEEHARTALALAPAGSATAARARLQLSAALLAGGQLESASGELDRVDAGLFAGGQAAVGERARAMALRAAIFDARGQAEQAETQLAHAIETAESTAGMPSRLAIDLRLDLARQFILHRREEAARAVLAPALAALRGAAVETALIQAEMGALTLHAGASRAGIEEALATVERSHQSIEASEARASPLQKAWADVYAAQAALSRGHIERARSLVAEAGNMLLPLTHGPRARVQLLALLTQVAVRAGATAEAEKLLGDWSELALARFPREVWKAHLVDAENLVNQARWKEAEAALARVAHDLDAGAASGGDEARARIADERLRAVLDRGDRGDQAEALLLAEASPAAVDASRRAEALCHSGRPAAGLAWLDQFPLAGADPRSPDLARRHAVRGLCLLAAGNLAEAAAMARQSRSVFDSQPGVSPAYQRVLQRLTDTLPSLAQVRVNPLR